MVNHNKPLKTIVNQFNEDEMLKYKERRRFDTYRGKAHYYFDKIWQQAKIATRDELYVWLSDRLNTTEEKAHFSQMDNATCIKAIYFCQQLLNDNRRMDLDFGATPITPFYIL